MESVWFRVRFRVATVRYAAPYEQYDEPRTNIIYGAQRHHVSLLSAVAVLKDQFIVPKRKYRYIITNSIKQSPSDTLIVPQTEKSFPRFSWNSKVRYRVLRRPINGTYTRSNECSSHACALFQHKAKNNVNCSPQRHYWYTFQCFVDACCLHFQDGSESFYLMLDVVTFIKIPMFRGCLLPPFSGRFRELLPDAGCSNLHQNSNVSWTLAASIFRTVPRVTTWCWM